MLHQWNVTIPSLTGRTPRTAFVYVPDFCEDDPDLRLPVLYMFDGHNVFEDEYSSYGKSWGMRDFLDMNDLPLIVAGVECNHDPDPQKGRLSEYSPFDFDDPEYGFVPGRGRQTMDWMTKVFKPMIDRRFPTLPGRKYTFIGGSSMGGLMTLYAVSRYNHIYSRAAALSPSLWVDPEGCKRLASNPRMRRDTVIYMDYGSEELRSHDGMLPIYNAVSSELLRRGVFLTSRIVPYGDHTEASWEKQLPFFLGTLLYDL